MRAHLAVLCAVFIALAAALSSAVAQEDASLEAGLQNLTTGRFSDTETAIGQIADSGNPIALKILVAAGDRRLYYSASTKAVVFKDAAGKSYDAKTGELITPPTDLKSVRLNNKLRGVIEEAIGGLSLRSPDPGQRLDAAATLFRTRDSGNLTALNKALEKEKIPEIRKALSEARAATLLTSSGHPDAEMKAAIATLEERGDQVSLSIIQSIPNAASADVRAAAASAAKNIEMRLTMWGILQNLWYGLSLGSVLLLAAIGLAITFGVMGVINMAHGEMVMIGAYATFVVQEVIRSLAPGLIDYSLFFAVPLAFLAAGAVGVAIERGVIRFLYGRPLDTLLATWGISLILQQTVRTIFGPTNREVSTPAFMSGAFEIGQLSITWNRLWIIVFAAVIFACLLLVLRYTSIGLQMRAVTQNRRMAGSMGIRTGRVDALTFGLGSGIAGLAGVALSQIDNVSPNLGQSYIVDSFIVVIFGGVGNLWGTLIGAMSLGVANKFLEPVAGAVLGKILLLVLIILFIQKRPRGLFALKGRAIEQ